MSKKLKKRLLALLLTLALCTAMMLSGSAATVPSEDSNYKHEHIWNITNELLRYDYINPTYHVPIYGEWKRCAVKGCLVVIPPQSEFPGSYEPHNNGSYCTLCNHQVQMSIPGSEIMCEEDENHC